MISPKFKKAVGWAAVLLGLCLAAPLWAQTGGLTGTVTLQDGSRCFKCTVSIDRLDIKGIYKVKTDKKGHYIYIGLPIGNYKVVLLDPKGNQLYYFNGVHIGLGDPTPLNFNLPKEMKQAAQSNPQAAQQVQQQAKEAKKFAGLKQYFDQGNALYNQKQYAQAAAAFEKAVPFAAGKNLPVVLARLADAYHQAHMDAKALTTYQKILQLTPDDAGIYNNLGNVYATMGNSAAAAQAFQKAASLDPTHAAMYYFNLGAIMYNQGKMDQAADAFKKATTADPKYAEAYYLEGQALMSKATMTANGKVSAPPGTLEAFKEYIKLAPNGPDAAAAQGMIQTLEGKVPTQYKKR